MKKTPILLFIVLFLLAQSCASTRVHAIEYFGISVNDSLVKIKADSAMTAFYEQNALLGVNKKIVNQIEKQRPFINKTLSFYLVLLLLFVLGILRVIFPTFFRNLYNAFMSPMINKRQLRDQIAQNVQANTAMNIFFCISLGFYVYSVLFSQTEVIKNAPFSPNVILSAFVLIVGLIYFTKFVLLKFVGWVFKIDALTEAYSYNVFLINKILSIILLPFSIIMAFGSGAWLQVIFLISLLIIAVLLFNRYSRSWSSLGSFFQFSKFHFFMYFCASELLPLAVLVKLVIFWLV